MYKEEAYWQTERETFIINAKYNQAQIERLANELFQLKAEL